MKIKNIYNPDVLTCLANLSNDEVFTPPSVVNKILDLLPKEIWGNKDIKFLDPACKTGVFLREITKRLDLGLESIITNKEQRLNHILTKQVFGIAISELTSLMSRRSVYCTKNALSKYSLANNFVTEEGNIYYKKQQHSWLNNKCRFCGASESTFGRSDEYESYAYPFIHTNYPEEIFQMKFDVIVGNPPYQLNDGGGTGSSAIPIYHKFIQQAIKLNPKYITMIIPSRWLSGGRGLDAFRDEMLNDQRITQIHDFLSASDCFPGVEIKGGVLYFLWSQEKNMDCEIFTYKDNKLLSSAKRPMLEKGAETFIRYNEAISILNKVKNQNETSFSTLISSNDPFGFDVREVNSYKRVKANFKLSKFSNAVEFYYNGWRRDGVGYISKDEIKKNLPWVNKVKVLIPKAWGTGTMGVDWISPFIVNSNSCCTETYLVVGPFENEKIAVNVISYTQTIFFHFLLSLIKITQNTMKKAYTFIPLQNFEEKWTDEKLFKKYGLSEAEIQFIQQNFSSIESNINE